MSAELSSMVAELYQVRQERKRVEAIDSALTERIKSDLADSGLPEWYDGETQVLAALQERTMSPALDIVQIARSDHALLIELAAAGVLSATTKAADKYPELAARCIDYVLPARKIVALTVVKHDD